MQSYYDNSAMKRINFVLFNLVNLRLRKNGGAFYHVEVDSLYLWIVPESMFLLLT